MKAEQPFELGWWGQGKPSDMELAKKALMESRLREDLKQNGYVTVTLYPNDLFFILYRESKPPRKYFNATNAAIFTITDGEFATVQSRDNPTQPQEHES